MLFGISTKVLRDYRLEEAISIAGKWGYDAIEIWIDDFVSSGLTPNQIIELTDSNNLKRTVHLRTDDLNICSFNEGIRKESVKQAKEGVFIASQIKASEATLHPGRKTSKTHSVDDAWTVQIQSIREIAERAKKCNLTLCVEGMEKVSGEFILTPQDLSQVVEKCQNGALGVTIDVSHLQTIGDALNILNKCMNLPIHNVHVSQTTLTSLHLPLYLNEGDINYRSIFSILQTFYNKAVIVEGYKKNIGMEIAEQSIKWYKEIIKELNYEK
ncbi:MAG: sugar phosphate isomerase/epimerase [Ruminococcaceae bacterium]|nr:sugar phosphate isomerase/epimerase [Oscillospiraceae bacterium]